MSEVVLPEGWCLASIADIAEVKGGKRLPKGEKFSNVKTAYPYLRVTDFESGSVNSVNLKYISGSTFEKIRNYTIGKDDLYISIAGTIGLVGNIPLSLDGANLTENAAKLCNIVGIDNNYLVKLLGSNESKQQFSDKEVSSGQPKLALFRIKECQIPLAPLAEQKKIAAQLDTLLAQVDKIKTRLDAIPAILKRFRQSVLAAAVSGKFTEAWRSQVDTQDVSESEGWNWGSIPSSWDVVYYPEVVESRLGKMLDKSKNSGISTQYLGNVNVRWFEFDIENLQEILVSEKEQQELSIKKGDVLICEGGEPGRCAIWNKESQDPIVFQKALHRARVSERLIPDWLVINLKNDADRLTLNQLFTGTTIKHLTGKALKRYPLRLPPKEEQTEIVRCVDQLFTFADQIEAQVSNAQSRVNNLTQSILAKAFRGELTADWRAEHPELISGEHSAEALLARIKAEQAKLSAKKTPRTRRKPSA